MSDLVVKFRELEDSQAALKTVMVEFDKTEHRVDGLDAYQHSAKCLQSWLKVDGSLAQSLHTHNHQAPSAGHTRVEN